MLEVTLSAPSLQRALKQTSLRYLGAYVARLVLLSPQEDLRPSIFILTSQWLHSFCGDVWNTGFVQQVISIMWSNTSMAKDLETLSEWSVPSSHEPSSVLKVLHSEKKEITVVQIDAIA